MNRVAYWVKFERMQRPERWEAPHFEAFWYDLRERSLRNNIGKLEWMMEAY